MDSREHHPSRSTAAVAVAVAVLHGGVVWTLLTAGLPRVLQQQTPRNGAREIELWLIPPETSPSHSLRAPPAQRGLGAVSEFPRRFGHRPPAPTPTPPANGAEAPVDWTAELERAGRAALRPETPATRSFDFPRHDATPPPPREFGWDRTHTHRVEAIPEGGLLIHLNDRCVLVLTPLPMAACSLHKPAADGGLFDGMAASRETAPSDDIP